jgi:2-dehydro-3-deoxygluconokinase
VISLAGAERSFSYWRESSAARRLADDLDALRAAFSGYALIHVSGITLAVIGEAGRANLHRALSAARDAGAAVSFDPNIRTQLWPDLDSARDAIRVMLQVTDIALPSFEDEALVWADADPGRTIARLATEGVREIVVKNGAGEVAAFSGDAVTRRPTPVVTDIRDTTGAGDAFNAGYLAARVVGMAPDKAISVAQRVSGAVIGHFGALAPREALDAFRAILHLTVT